MLDYTALQVADGSIVQAPIIRGYAWPAGGRTFALRLLKDDGWVNGEDSWTWRLRFDDRAAGGAADVSATATSAVISTPAGGAANSLLTLTFALTASDTADLAGTGKADIMVDLESEDTATPPEPSLWPEAQGRATVRNAVGGP